MPNTQPFGQGLNTVLRIEIDCTAAGNCLTVSASDTTIKGLVLNRTSADTIHLSNGAGNPFADWIEQLSAEGITGGCGGTNYCPAQPVRRDQMAAFLYNTFQFP